MFHAFLIRILLRSFSVSLIYAVEKKKKSLCTLCVCLFAIFIVKKFTFIRSSGWDSVMCVYVHNSTVHFAKLNNWIRRKVVSFEERQWFCENAIKITWNENKNTINIFLSSERKNKQKIQVGCGICLEKCRLRETNEKHERCSFIAIGVLLF